MAVSQDIIKQIENSCKPDLFIDGNIYYYIGTSNKKQVLVFNEVCEEKEFSYVEVFEIAHDVLHELDRHVNSGKNFISECASKEQIIEMINKSENIHGIRLNHRKFEGAYEKIFINL